jgi:hypothetical protein
MLSLRTANYVAVDATREEANTVPTTEMQKRTPLH